MTEEELRTNYLREALRFGFSMQYHTYDSRKSGPGFPDDVLVNTDAGRVLFIEAKSADGKVKAEQQNWHDALAMCDQEIYVVRPQHWESGEIIEILTLKEKPSKAVRMNLDSAVVVK